MVEVMVGCAGLHRAGSGYPQSFGRTMEVSIFRDIARAAQLTILSICIVELVVMSR